MLWPDKILHVSALLISWNTISRIQNFLWNRHFILIVNLFSSYYSLQSFNYSTICDTRNEFLNTDTRLVLASCWVIWYSGEAESLGYLFGNSNTLYVFSILLRPYGPDWIYALGIFNNKSGHSFDWQVKRTRQQPYHISEGEIMFSKIFSKS